MNLSCLLVCTPQIWLVGWLAITTVSFPLCHHPQQQHPSQDLHPAFSRALGCSHLSGVFIGGTYPERNSIRNLYSFCLPTSSILLSASLLESTVGRPGPFSHLVGQSTTGWSTLAFSPHSGQGDFIRLPPIRGSSVDILAISTW